MKPTRICLKCRKEFPVKYEGNFLCNNCRSYNKKKMSGIPRCSSLGTERRGGIKGSS